jgi:hypothetical protein
MKTRILIGAALMSAAAIVATSFVSTEAQAGSKVTIAKNGTVSIAMGAKGKRNRVKIRQSGINNTLVATGGAATAGYAGLAAAIQADDVADGDPLFDANGQPIARYATPVVVQQAPATVTVIQITPGKKLKTRKINTRNVQIIVKN